MKSLGHYFVKGAFSIFVLGLVACNGNQTDIKEQKIVNVKAVSVADSSTVNQREYVGTVEGENVVDVSFQISGNIASIYVQEGQSVQKGQLLAKLNTSTFENIYASAKATLSQAKDAFDRMSVLYENKSLPEIKYIEVKTSLEQAQANERIAKKNLSDCNLYAPFSGVIGRKNVEAGANVMAGSPVVNLMNISTVKIKVAIPENEISSIQVGDRCKVVVTAMGNAAFEGKIIEKGILAHPVSHTYEVKVQLPNSKKDIMPGMVCKAYLENKNKTNRITVPIKSVQVDISGRHFVWLIGASDTAQYQEVKVGELIGNDVVIESGLKAGDRLIVEGYQKLSPGVSVKSL